MLVNITIALLLCKWLVLSCFYALPFPWFHCWLHWLAPWILCCIVSWLAPWWACWWPAYLCLFHKRENIHCYSPLLLLLLLSSLLLSSLLLSSFVVVVILLQPGKLNWFLHYSWDNVLDQGHPSPSPCCKQLFFYISVVGLTISWQVLFHLSLTRPCIFAMP